MNRILLSIALACLVAAASLPVAAAAPTPAAAPRAESADLQAFKKAIRAKYDLKEKAWAAQDHVGLVKGFYSPHAFTAAEGEPKFYAQGREQFLELYKTFVADTTKIRIESVHTHVNGNMGWDWTNFHADVKPEKVKDYPPSPVRILFVWEKINGQWMCAGDVVLLGTFDTAVKGK
ncbi:MAG: nuclear transport factor 2 family protein [Burkholderiaceae bacterium]|nr:nuclear transport factor 2 family protein [Burkholderiaceae bacterium]